MFWKKENKKEDLIVNELSAVQLKYLDAKAELKELEFEKSKMQDIMDNEKRKLKQEKDLWKEKAKQEHENLKASLILKHEQEIAQIKQEFEKKLNDKAIASEKALLSEKERLNKEFYDKMTSTLEEIHSKGNHTTDFLKEMTLKMMDKQTAMLTNNICEEEYSD